ncbi:uncharacterized protein LOC120330127 [Styela clava]
MKLVSCCILVLIPLLVYSQEINRCRDGSGLARQMFPFTKPMTCAEGIYYTCEDGVEIQHICPEQGHAFNSKTEACESDIDGACSAAAVCPTNHVAGPHPNGYECMEDCTRVGMCWDNRTQKCLCQDNVSCPKQPLPESKCSQSSPAVVHCNPAASLEVYADISSCSNFFLCIFGSRYHFNCAEGEYFSKNAPSYCDVSSNIAPPCGTLYY